MGGNVTKNKLIFGIKVCINTYKGLHGKVKKLFPIWQENITSTVEYYFGVKNGVLEIAFRGSDRSKEAQSKVTGFFKKLFLAWRDWAQNLDFNGIDIDGGTIHQGTYEDYIKVKRHCFDEIKKYKKIVIEGHSRGAMLAGVLCYFAKKNFPDKDIQGVAYAPAKFMSKHFKEAMKDFYTIINGEDWIPKLPWHKFKHMGKVIRIGFRVPIILWIPFIRVIGAGTSHPPLEYLKQLKKYTKMIP